MTARYAAPARALAARVEARAPTGVGLVVCPHTEEPTVAAALAAALGWDPPVPMTPEAIDRAGRQVFLGLAADDDTLRHLNGRRDWLKLHGALLLVPVPQHQTRRFVTLCGDVMATIALNVDIPFEPDPAVDPAAARAALAAAYDRRFGRLDLRGLVRRTENDVGWEIDALYQPLRAAPGPFPLPEALGALVLEGTADTLTAHLQPTRPLDPKRPLIGQLEDPPLDRPLLLLGGPGSGKSFFLRWCARHGARAPLLGVETPLPVLVPLAAYAAGPIQQTLAEWMTDQLLDLAPPAAHALPGAIAERRAIFLLDGLDEAGSRIGRRRALDAITALRRDAPGCPILITSRPEGFSPEHLPDVHVARVEPFDGDEIRAFLRGWSGQYAVDLRGPDARADGEAEGEKLADAILARREIEALAGTPLLLTVLALVHRMGARLPEKRIDLYAQVTEVLVERWNRVRSLTGADLGSPLRTGDAIRLLGPVAWEMVERNERGSITEDRLRAHLKRALDHGAARGFEDPGALIDLFRTSLGLLVEQSPGRYAFAHSTLIEYFAARELARGRGLEALIEEGDPFDPNLREVILLGLTQVGYVQLDDWRLGELIDALLKRVPDGIRDNKPANVLALLGELVLDDPALSETQARDVIEVIKREAEFAPPAEDWRAVYPSHIGTTAVQVAKLEAHIRTLRLVQTVLRLIRRIRADHTQHDALVEALSQRGWNAFLNATVARLASSAAAPESS